MGSATGAAAGSADDRRLVRVQALSGALFALFLLVHLVNQMLAALGPEVYNGAQRALRRGYQAPPLEIFLVIAPLLIHAATAVLRIIRRYRRRRQHGRRPASNPWARAHRITGLVMLVFFAGHVLATRGASLLYGVYPEFAGLAFTLRWVPAYFWPYYTAFALSGLYHAIYGLGVALPVLGLRFGSGLRRPLVLVPLVALGGAAIVLGMLGLGGVLFDVGRPEQHAYPQLLMRLGVASAPAAPR
jgi:succinate dehydrogenase/fumarate reductase cytochrome b subunit